MRKYGLIGNLLSIITFSKHTADTNCFVFETDTVRRNTLHEHLPLAGSACATDANLPGPSSYHSTDRKAASSEALDSMGRSTLLTTIGETVSPCADGDFTANDQRSEYIK